VSLVEDRADVTGQRASRARVVRRALAAIAVGGAAVGLFACYLRVSATFATGSDGASNALEAWDLVHGNWLLRGWTLTDVSFYTTELPEYALVELVHGLRPDVVHIAAAITYTLLVLTAAALARGRASGAEGRARGLIAAGLMLAPQLGNGVHVLLSQPDHVGTQVLLLAIFLLVDRAPRAGPGRLARGAPPDGRPRHLHRGQHHHPGQRRRRPDADGHVAAAGRRRHGGPAVPVVGLLVRPPHRVRQLRGHRDRRRAI